MKITLDFLSTNNYNNYRNSKSEVRKMSPRTGRPKSDNPKSNDIKVRLDDITHESLLKYCEEHQISKAEAVRRGIHLVLQQK